MSTQTRRISEDGEEVGEYNLRELQRALENEELEGVVEFWSEFAQAWLPVQHIMTDIEREDRGDGLTRLDDLRRAGIRHVEILGMDDECEECQAVTGKVYPIEKLPQFPPEYCTCVPWCRGTIVAVEEPEG